MLEAEHARADPPPDARPTSPAGTGEDPFDQEAADYYITRFLESVGRFDMATLQWEGELDASLCQCPWRTERNRHCHRSTGVIPDSQHRDLLPTRRPMYARPISK